MTLNEYDDMLGPSDPASAEKPANEYDALIDQDKSEQKQQLQGAMFVASKAEPDRRAKAMKLAEKYSLPVDLAERQFDVLSQKEAQIEPDYDQLMDQNPKLSAWLQDPNNAAIAKDDIENLKGVERTVRDHSMMQTMYSSLNAGLASMYSGIARVPALTYDAFALPQNLVARYADMPALRAQSPDWLMNNPVAKYYDKAQEAFRVPEMDQSIISEISKGNYSRAGMTLAAQFVANAPQQAAIIAGSLAGFGVPTLVGAGAVTAADANKTARDMGVAPEVATVNALTKGTIEAGFESLGTFGVLKQWEAAIAKQYGKEVSKQVFKDFAKSIAYSVAAEGNEEALTSAAQDLTDYITGVNPNALEGLPQRAMDAGILGGVSGGAMTAPSATLAGAHRGAKIRQSTLARDFYLALGKSAEATKLRERLPEGNRKLVEQITKGSPVENVYIAPEALDTYFQKKDINPTAAMQESGVLQAYTEAKETGAKVEVPIATWANKFVGTEHYEGLADDISFDPAGQSVNELKSEGEEIKAQLEKEAKAAESLAPAPEAIAAEEQAKAIRDTVSKQIQATGTDAKTADSYAQIYEAGFKALGERAGVNPLDLFSRYALSIRNEGQEQAAPEGTLNQELAAMQAPNVDEATKPIDTGKSFEQGSKKAARIQRAKELGFDTSKVYYHGTPGGRLDEFSHANSNYTGIAAFLTPEKDFARKFAKEPYYAEMKPGWDKETDKPSAPFIHKVYLKANNTFDYENKKHVARLAKELKGALHPDVAASNIAAIKIQIEDASHKMWQVLEDPAVVKAIRSAGFDSMFVSELGVKNIAVFEPNQIRSINAEFDPDEADSPKIYAQGAALDEARGRIQFGKSGVVIEFSKAKDHSTLFHETGHFYLEVMGDLATREGSPQQVKDDYAALLNWLGVSSREEIKTAHHEKFARGFEAYIMEGKAPSQALRRAFSKFKLWLISVYKHIRRLNVELTPEVRQVMDRMLATDEEIEALKREQNIEPLFVDPRSMGMSEKQTYAYLNAVFDAEETAKEELNAKAQREYARRQTAAYKEEREYVRAEIEKDVSALPVYQAIDKIKANKEVRLSRAALSEYGENVPNRLQRGLVAPKGQGLHPDVAAPILGFQSGRELVSALTTAQPKDAVIDQRADIEMERLHPDLMTNGELPQEALNALHNRSRSKLLRMELEHLATSHMPVLKDVIRRVVRRVPTEAAVREQAKAIIETKAVKDMRPILYQRAEVKAAKLAGQLLAKGDIDGAFQAKRSELLNHELYRAAVAAREDMEESLEDFRRLAKPDEQVAKTRDTDLVNTARAILADIGIGKSEKPASAYLDKIKRYDPQMYETAQALIETVSAQDMHYTQLSYGDFVAVRDTVNALWDLAKTTREIEVGGKILDRDQAISELQAQISEVTSPKAKPGFNRAVSNWDKTKIKLLGARASLTRVEAFAEAADLGNPGGPFRKYIWQPVSDATTKYRLEKQKVIAKLEGILRDWAKGETRKPIEVPELGYTFRDKTELMMAVLHSGNTSNLDKLLRGRGWGEEAPDGSVDRSRFDRAIARLQKEGVLTKKDYDFAQAVWDLNEELKPEAQRAHKKIHGYYFSEITANEIVTPFGIYRGGYIPAKVDLYTTEDASIRAEREAFENNNNSFQFPTTGRGFTRSRTQAYAAPLSLEMSLLSSHIDGVLRFTHIEPTVRSVARIAQDKGFRDALSHLDPTAGKELLTPWLQRAAQQRVVLPSESGIGRVLDSVARVLRRNVAMQLMVGNVTNALQQFTGVIVAASKVKPVYLRSALSTYVRAPRATVDAIMEKSEWMRSIQGSTIYESQQAIEKIILDPNAFQSAQEFAKRHTYFLQAATQNIVNAIVWNGAYEQAIANKADEHSAVKQADSAVRMTQGSNSPEDISRFETGTATARLFTQFAGYFNMLANLNGSELAKISREVGLKKGAGRVFALYLTAFMIPAALSEIIVRLMGGKGLDEDDDGYLNDLLAVFFGSQAKTATALIPYGGQLLNASLNNFNGNRYDDRLSISPVVSFLETFSGVPAEVYKAMNGEMKSSKKVTKDVLSLVGVASGLPVGPVGKPIGYLMDVSSGKAKPSGPIDAARGLVTGKAGVK